MRRFLLGYDVRLAADHYVALRWDDQGRRVYLLRPDVDWPLSVDPSVWPSIFQYQGANVAARYLPISGWIDVEPADFPHRVLDLWQEEAAMMAEFQAAPSAISPGAVAVAIEVVMDEASFPGSHWGPLFAGEDRPQVSEDWTLLGYDVADTSYTSGLSNCGYRDVEKPGLQQRFAGALNDHGLFDDADAAAEFRDEADRRIAEHAPFHVFALHRRPSLP